MAGTNSLLQFLPFSSVVASDFWHKLAHLKIDVFALRDEPIDITGYYTNHTAPKLPACFNVDYSSFEKSSSGVSSSPRITCQGSLHNTNTIEVFKDLDKQATINEFGKKIWSDITSGAALEDPSLLSRFILLTFAELKKHHFYYWFAFPALASPSKYSLSSEPKEIDLLLSVDQITQLQAAYDEFKTNCGQSAFLIDQNDGRYRFYPLAQLSQLQTPFWLGFCDPSSLPTNPGWPLRNLLALLAYHRPECLPGLSVLCWRDGTRDGQRRVGHSLLFTIKDFDPIEKEGVIKCVGWEKNERGKLGARMVNLAASMDPERLAASAVDLNLKLMKWRLLPELDLDVIHQTKCLLLGAGTLGCSVARTLMAWGVRHITFVDNGRVGYSNPVRQSLYRFEHCLTGGQYKAECAAQSLKQVFPGMMTRGIDLRIPMPGHSVAIASDGSGGGQADGGTQEDVRQLVEAVKEHDVIFLLTDTRESRWLPTMLAAYHGKLVINAALGFDTFLVMRHGQRDPWIPGQPIPERSMGIMRGSLPGSSLGCYFCNDVVAPGDSTKDRTLDQQCTVTRPGVSLIAGALAAELMVSVLQHPDRGNAAAEIVNSDSTSTTGETAQRQRLATEISPLGVVPHSIRGFLHRHQQVLPATEAFYNCTACSPLILQAYAQSGYSFLLDVFNSPDHLERISGLEDLHKNMVASAVEDWDYPEESESSE